MNELQGKQTLTVDDIRGILGVGQNSAYKLIHSSAFPVKKIGRSYRIPTKTFLLWLETHSTSQDNEWNSRPAY